MASAEIVSLAGLTTLVVLALVMVLLLSHRRQQAQIDRLMQRLEKLEASRHDDAPSLDGSDTVEAPLAPGATAAALPPAESDRRADILAGWTSHVRHVVDGKDSDAVGLADQAIVRIHRRLDANLSPSDLAAALCVSLRTLERGLAAALDCTPSELILAMKMREARRLLLSGRYRVAEVADRLGFSTPFHFSRRFKAYYRVPPSELRETGSGHR